MRSMGLEVSDRPLSAMEMTSWRSVEVVTFAFPSLRQTGSKELAANKMNSILLLTNHENNLLLIQCHTVRKQHVVKTKPFSSCINVEYFN